MVKDIEGMDNNNKYNNWNNMDIVCTGEINHKHYEK